MKNRMTKKRMPALLLALVLVFGMCLNLSMTVSAAEPTQSPAVPDDATVRDYALHFMVESQEGKDNLEIADFYHLTDGNGKLTGYYVSFTDAGECAGYTLLSLISGEDPIVEFAFEGPGPLADEDAASALSSEVQPLALEDDADASAENEGIVFRGPDQLYIPIGENEYYSVYDHDSLTLEKDQSRSIEEVDLYAGIIDWSAANIKNNTVFKIANFGTGKDYFLMHKFSDGDVCAPTAGTNILWYWGKMRGRSNVMDRVASSSDKPTAIFNILVYNMGTFEHPGVIGDHSGTWWVNILSGYVGFFGEQANWGKWNYKELPNGTTYSTYKKELQNNCPIHLSVHTGKRGHDVMNMGYAESQSGVPYLMVMDGWKEYGRFIRFNYYPEMRGYKIWVA